MEAVLTIGDFARATHLSVKMLRHYHDLGLLVPAEVDARSGYRRYETDQIQTAQLIRRFRDLDMPLDDIGAVLSTTDLHVRNELITAHLTRLEQGLARTERAVASLRALLAESTPPSIELRRLPATPAAAISETVELGDLGPWLRGGFGELDAAIAAQHASATGPPAGTFATDLFTDGRGSATIFVPCADLLRPIGRVHPTVIPASDLAVIVHAGDHTDIDLTYGALATYVSERALAADGPIRETYLVGDDTSADQAARRTEIGWPIFHPGTAG